MAGLVESDPVKFSSVLASSRVIPGDVITLLPGTYGAGKNKFTPQKWIGTSEKPITIKPKIPGTVRINGGLELLAGKAAHVIVKDLEIGPTPTSRLFADYASVDYPPSVYVTAPGCQIVGNHIKNGMNGVAMFGTGGGLIAENIFSGVGFIAGDGDHGTNIYTHNHTGGQIDILHNLFDTCFGAHGVDMWSAGSNNVQDYYTRENIIIGRRLMVGGLSGLIRNNKINDNHVAMSEIRLGLGGASNRDNNGSLEVLRNRQWGGHASLLLWCQNAAIVQSNVFVKTLSGATRIGYYAGNIDANSLDGNAYYNATGQNGIQDYDTGSILSIEQWQAKGYDVTSSFLDGLPSSNEIFVYPFHYSDWRVGIVAIWNWEGLDTVTVDLSSLGLTVGNTYRWRQGQDTESDTDIFIYDDNPVIFDMQNHSIATPTAHNAPLVGSTFPAFGIFVIEKQ